MPGSPAAGILGHALSIQGFLALQDNDLATARDLLGRARAVADGVEDDALEVRMLVVDTVAGMMEGDPSARGRLLDPPQTL